MQVDLAAWCRKSVSILKHSIAMFLYILKIKFQKISRTAESVPFHVDVSMTSNAELTRAVHVAWLMLLYMRNSLILCLL
jgi:hypothetical protein